MNDCKLLYLRFIMVMDLFQVCLALIYFVFGLQSEDHCSAANHKIKVNVENKTLKGAGPR